MRLRKQDKVVEFAQNLWERYGFKGNPFDTGPLSFKKNSLLPIEDAFIIRNTSEVTAV